MTHPPCLLHVGYHKTATTWMQEHLFKPPHGFFQLADHQEIHDRVVRPHGLAFSPEPMQALLAERLTARPEGTVPVVSSEILSGHPFYGGHSNDIYAERLSRIAPGSKVLISIRAQQRMLPSVYAQYVQRGGTMPYDQFFEGTDVPGFFGFEPAHFEYDRFVACYQRLFGVENVYVLTQESLKADMDAAARALAEFAGATLFDGLNPAAKKVHAPSYPEHALPVLRRINNLQSSVLTPAPAIWLGRRPLRLYRGAGGILRRPPFSNLLGKRKPVSDYVKRHFAGHYAQSNARLAAIVPHPLDLSAYERPDP